MRKERILVPMILVLSVAGCITDGIGVAPIPKTVEVPVAIKCDVKVDPHPPYPDTDDALAATPEIYSGVKLLKAGRLMRDAYIAELESTLNVCKS